MTTLQKSILALIGVVVIVGIYGGYRYLFSAPQQAQPLAGSTAGSTFLTSKVAEQTLLVSSTTVYSMLNSDASDRTITGAEAFFTGGTSTSTNYTIGCSTSTSAFATSSANNILYFVIPSLISSSLYGSTTNATGFMSSSSPGITGTTTNNAQNVTWAEQNSFARVWKTGTYLVCSSYASANNNLFDPNVTGYIAFPYRGQ